MSTDSLNQKVKGLETEIDKITSKINDLDYDNEQEKTKLIKANSNVMQAKADLEKAQRKIQDADAAVHAINAGQSKIAQERARFAIELTALNQKKQQVSEEIRREEASNRK